MVSNNSATMLRRTVTESSTPTPSPAYAASLRGEARRANLISITPAALLMAVLVLWEVLARTHIVNPVLTSYASAVWATFLELMRTGDLVGHTWATFRATLVGFTFSMVLG